MSLSMLLPFSAVVADVAVMAVTVNKCYNTRTALFITFVNVIGKLWRASAVVVLVVVSAFSLHLRLTVISRLN